MEKQRLMHEEETLIVRNVNHSLERSRSKNARTSDSNNESSSSSFLGSSKSDDRKEKPNIMSVLSDFFGVKTSKVNSMAVSVMMTVFYLMSVGVLLMGCESSVVGATPLAAARQHTMFHSSASARNIRHLPCISRRTKEEGICMFAIDCLKANGTHLGTCIDRFYFGSCCQMPEQLDSITTNHIEDNTIFGQTFSKPKPDKVEQGDKVNNDLNALSPLPSSTLAPATSPKTAIKTQNSETTQKPVSTSTEASNHYTTTTQNPRPLKPGYYSEKPNYSSHKPGVSSHKPSISSHKPGISSQKPGISSHKPGISSQKPSISSQKYGGSSQKPNSTITSNKMPSTVAQGTRRPYPSTISHGHFNHTKKPITTGTFVNNQIYSGVKLPAIHNATKLNSNQTKDSQPELLTSLKPTRNTTVQFSTAVPISSTAAPITTSAAPITTSAAPIPTSTAPITRPAAAITTTAAPITTTTNKSFYLPSRRPTTTTEKQSTSEASSTTTSKPFYMPSRRPTTTTEKPTTISQSGGPTSGSVVSHRFNVTKPAVPDYQNVRTKGTTTTSKPSPSTTTTITSSPSTTTSKTTIKIKPEAPTEVPYKISTFQSVQGGQTKRPSQRPTPSGNKPFITGKPIPEISDSDLPFGTRLPSNTFSPEKYTTPHVKPTPNNQQSPTSRPSTVSSITSTTTTSLPTQRPIQRPRPTYRPDKPTPKPEAVTVTTTNRPAVQRPHNSTLSNRRTTTTRPTTLVRKPIPAKPENVSTSVEPTRRPITTIIYRPSIETKPSLKPTYISQRPATTQKPTTSVNQTSSHPANVTRRPVITSSTGLASTNVTTLKPIRITENVTSQMSSPTKPPTTVELSTEAVKEKPVTTAAANTTSVLTTEKSTSAKPSIAQSTTRPASSYKPSQTTAKPYVRPSAPYVPLKPTVATQKPSTTTTRPIVNVVVEDNLAQKPIGDTKKPVTGTTEKLGLVTWSNYVEPAVSQSSTPSTTQKDEDWSPVTPPAEWILLQTISPLNLTGPTMQPSETVATSKKPILDAEKQPATSKPSTTSKPSPATAQAETTTKSPATEATTRKTPTKPVFTIHVTTRPVMRPASTNATTVKPMVELNTSMPVSEGPTTAKPSTSTVKVEAGNATVTDDEENTTLEETTTEDYENSTTLISETATNYTDGEAGITDKSTVSPIEGITSSGSPLATIDSLNMSDYKDVCGRRLWPEARVVGGSKANFGRWPWQVSLRQWRTSTYLHKCGAALLSENWAVTAAHCVDSVPPSDLLLRLGEHDLASEEEPYGFQERRVQIVASHPQFDPRTFEYDLALLRFYEPVTFQPNILPVCVPGNDEGFVGKTAYVTGWGRLYEDGPLPSILQEVSVPVLENQACEQMYRSAGYIEHIPHIFICAGWRKGGFDSCEGDSGGPMVLQREDKRFLLAGIISWGIGCAEPNQPGVYTRISEFRDWINQILQF